MWRHPTPLLYSESSPRRSQSTLCEATVGGRPGPLCLRRHGRRPINKKVQVSLRLNKKNLEVCEARPLLPTDHDLQCRRSLTTNDFAVFLDPEAEIHL